MKEEECRTTGNPYRYSFNRVFSLESNIPYFEGMFHSFSKSTEQNSGGYSEAFHFEFVLDKKLKISTHGKERVNLMLFNNRQDNSVEFNYPWFKPICAKLEFMDSTIRFTFNKYYLRFSNLVAEGWEIIDVFRSVLLSYLVKNKMYMFHAAAVRVGKEGILIPAFGNTGKTSTSWMLAKQGGEFLTDEFAIIDSEGNCFGLPCSSLVSRGTANKFGVKLTERQKIHLFWSDTKSRILSSRFAPGGIKIYPDSLFRFCDKAKITKLAIIENGPDSYNRIGRNEALLKIKAIQDYEFGWKSNPFLLARSFFSGFDINSLATMEDKFLESFLANLNEIHVVSSTSGSHYRALLGADSSAEVRVQEPQKFQA